MKGQPYSEPPTSSPQQSTASAGPPHESLLAVAEVGHELAAQDDIERRLTQALRVIERRLSAARSVLYVADSERRVLTIEATYGISRDQFRPRYGMGVAGRVAETGQPVVVPVVRHDPMALSELSDLSRWHDAGWNLVAVPFAPPGRPGGALCAYFRHREPSGVAERLSALDVVASLMWKAVRSARITAPAAGLRAMPDEAAPQAASGASFEYANMVGASPVMRQIYEQVSQVARTNATALLRGESGTGKELVARAIHDNSPRAAMPFVKVNCAALPEPLFESEVFGHERGAFTGAHTRKKGRFELAQGGTLLLDEIGELSLTTQAKLLRVLQFREFERLGGTETLKTDVRLVAATHVNMEHAVESGAFREDLYYRINIFTITLPPLRDRRADIPALAEYFLGKLAAEHGRRIGRISSGALDLLAAHPWPGNVRELENAIERAVVVCDGFVIQERHLPEALRSPARTGSTLSLSRAVDKLERQMIEDALRSEHGSISRAARVLETTERILRYKAQRLGVDPARFRA
jgi:Nif-specific regulatory protein